MKIPEAGISRPLHLGSLVVEAACHRSPKGGYPAIGATLGLAEDPGQRPLVAPRPSRQLGLECLKIRRPGCPPDGPPELLTGVDLGIDQRGNSHRARAYGPGPRRPEVLAARTVTVRSASRRHLVWAGRAVVPVPLTRVFPLPQTAPPHYWRRSAAASSSAPTVRPGSVPNPPCGSLSPPSNSISPRAPWSCAAISRSRSFSPSGSPAMRAASAPESSRPADRSGLASAATFSRSV